MQLPAESRQPVIQGPERSAAFRPGQHILFTAFGNGIVQQRIYGDQFRGRLDIKVVHPHAGNDTLRVVFYRLAQFPQSQEDPDPVVIEMRTGFQ